ncbi:MAG: outer membrane lipoprotein carrier protein LolA [Sandaracinaceae bacterium]|nr:outer membrane lipoprotein carrier protein LolA [Sandaracinaceae bacterium]
MNARVVRASLAMLSLCLVVCAAVGGPVRAQPPERPTATTVAAWVQAFYDQTQTLSARFVQRYVSEVYQRTDVSRGTVRFKKPGRMRFDYDEPNGKVVVSNGRTLVVYEPGDEGGAGQYFEQAMTDAQVPLALGFLTGTGRLDRDFSFRSLDPTQQGFPSGQVLELRARRPTPHYSRILLYVDADPARRGVVHRVLIVDQANNRNRFDFLEQRRNPELADTLFDWRPPAGARRVQP